MQNMRDLLRDSISRGLREWNDLDRLAAAWPVACGSSLATHAELSELDDARVLHITVASPEWMQPFLHSRTALQNDLARIAGVRLTGIHFEVKGSGRLQNTAPRQPFTPRKKK
jgi:Dna[CI] antecedent, DciA